MAEFTQDEIKAIMTRQEEWVTETATEWMEKFVKSGSAVEVTASLAMHLEKDTTYSRSNMAELVAITIAALAKQRMQ